MLTESEAPAIAAEVQMAMESLLAHSPGSLTDFQETFHKRTHLAGVVEAIKGIRGIEGALAEILPTGFQIDPKGIERTETPDPGFVREIGRAIELLVQQDPLALLILKRNQLRKGCSLEQALKGVLSEYAKRGMAYPY